MDLSFVFPVFDAFMWYCTIYEMSSFIITRYWRAHVFFVDGWFSAAMWDPVMPQRALTMSISLLCLLVDLGSLSASGLPGI